MNPNPQKQKKRQILVVFESVCFGFVHLPYIWPIPFQIIGQKQVQRCETQVEAESSKASYRCCF